MRCLLFAFTIFVALILFASTARVCVLDRRNCWRQRKSYARVGHSNLCQNFSNNCDLQTANCQQTARSYRTFWAIGKTISINNSFYFSFRIHHSRRFSLQSVE